MIRFFLPYGGFAPWVALNLVWAIAPTPHARAGGTVADTTLVVVRDVAIDESFTYVDARHRALEAAMAEATRVYGLFVESSQGLVTGEAEGAPTDAYWSVVAGDAVGVVTDYAIESEGAFQEEGRSWYRFAFRIRVERQPFSAGDPGYAVAVTLNQSRFVDSGESESGEEMIVSVEPTRDSYLTLLYQRGDSLWVLYPNPVAARQRVAAGTPFVYPSEELRAAGLRLRPAAPAGRTASREFILALATRDLRPFSCGAQEIVRDAVEATGCSLRDLGRWRISVPRDQRALGAHHYLIERTH